MNKGNPEIRQNTNYTRIQKKGRKKEHVLGEGSTPSTYQPSIKLIPEGSMVELPGSK